MLHNLSFVTFRIILKEPVKEIPLLSPEAREQKLYPKSFLLSTKMIAFFSFIKPVYVKYFNYVKWIIVKHLRFPHTSISISTKMI
jgi:hypothetical protein